MKCDIYKTSSEPIVLLIVKQGTSLYQLDNLSSNINLDEFSLQNTLNISANTPLVGVSDDTIINSINSKGFYITENNETAKNASIGAGLGAGILAVSLGLTPFGSILAGIVTALLVAKSREKK
ncbi:hypothetical protein [Aeromonas salmonicida]|uniref:hypothetical protein n=1 Tax=Aeromonas salmonicida TaxID=645 RepID=UPI001111E3FF|nr:hypothetical protein [Aeromonas salmonicida]MDE7527958.1 hypothetical protein [Aeromonas salmonicida]MDE7532308.1 hypothetical protein [Aeromonas salmonicida]